MTINNPEGSDDFKSILGDHKDGNLNGNVVVVNGIAGTTKNVPAIICKQFKNLKQLNFKNLAVELLTSSSFGLCANLETIDVSSNKIIAVDENSFATLPKLTTLNLKANLNIQLPPSVFSTLLNLNAIYLSGCNLNRWHFNWFFNLPLLRTVDFDNNHLVEVPIPAFHPQAPLYTLMINNNKISELRRASFERLDCLQNIYATQNEIIDIDKLIFDDALMLVNAHFKDNLCVRGNIYDFNSNRTESINFFQNCFQKSQFGPWSEYEEQRDAIFLKTKSLFLKK